MSTITSEYLLFTIFMVVVIYSFSLFFRVCADVVPPSWPQPAGLDGITVIVFAELQDCHSEKPQVPWPVQV